MLFRRFTHRMSTLLWVMICPMILATALAVSGVYAADCTTYFNDCSRSIPWTSTLDEAQAGSPTWNSNAACIVSFHDGTSGSTNSNRAIRITGLTASHSYTVKFKVRIDANSGNYWFEGGAKAGAFAASDVNGWSYSANGMFAKWDAWGSGVIGTTTNGWYQASKSGFTGNTTITIGFKHGGENAQNVYIDDITVIDNSGTCTPADPDITGPAYGGTITPSITTNQAPNIAISVQDVQSGLRVASSQYSFSKDNGTTWSPWYGNSAIRAKAATTGSYWYPDICKPNYTVISGDVLQYDMLYTVNQRHGCIDLEFTSGNLRDSGVTGTDGLSNHPSTNFFAQAYPNWYHREISLSSFAGKTITAIEQAVDGGQTSSEYYVRNVRIVNGSTVKVNAYQGESTFTLPSEQFGPASSGYASLTLDISDPDTATSCSSDGSDGSKNSQTITANGVQFNQISPTQNKIKFGMIDMAGNFTVSSVFNVDIGNSPTISSHPTNQSKDVGQTATFSVAASGSGTLTYQWQKMPSGGTWASISGATSASYPTPALVLGDNNAQYRCIVTSIYGTITSNPATLTVGCTSPASPGVPTVTATGADTLSVANNSSDSSATSIFYAFRVMYGTTTKYVSATGTLVDALVWQNKGTWSTRSITGLGVNTQYTLAVQAANSASGTCPSGWSGTVAKYTLANAPVAPTVGGATADTLIVSVGTGDGNPATTTYAIRINGGAYTDQYVQSNGSVGPSPAWQAASAWVTKVVTGLTQGTQYTFAVKARNGELIPVETLFGASVPGTTLASAERVTNGDFSCGNVGWTGNWTERGTITRNFASANLPSGSSGTCLEMSSTDGNGGVYQQLSLVSGQTYTLSLKSRDVNSDASSAWAEILIGASVPAASGSDYTTVVLQKWDTWTCDNWNGTAACVTNTTSFVATADTMYLVLKVGQTDGNKKVDVSFDSISIAGPPPSTGTTPSISTQPLDLAACNGATAAFSVAATGSFPLFYKWQVDPDGSGAQPFSDITGATCASYQITAASADNGKKYRCIVTNSYGSAQSSAATLTVNTTPVITGHPSSTVNDIGDSMTFAVAATGNGLSYQWRKNTAAITGATSASFNIASVVSGDAGSYDCVVTNTCGSVTSSAATLTVNAPPPPAAPTSAAAANITANSIRWAWTDNSTDETGFKVYAGPGAVAPTTVTDTTAVDATYWDHITLLANAQYAFQVAAANTMGDSAKTANISAWTLANTPGAPVVDGPGSDSLTVAIASGDGNPATTQYAIQISPALGGDSWIQPDGTVGSTEAWKTAAEWGIVTVSTLASTTEYTFKAKARNGADVETPFSAGAIGITCYGDEMLTNGGLSLAFALDSCQSNPGAFTGWTLVSGQTWYDDSKLKANSMGCNNPANAVIVQTFGMTAGSKCYTASFKMRHDNYPDTGAWSKGWGRMTVYYYTDSSMAVPCSPASDTTGSVTNPANLSWYTIKLAKNTPANCRFIRVEVTCHAEQFNAGNGFTDIDDVSFKTDGSTVCNAPAIATNPVNQTACVGGSVTFTVTATGTAPLSYQWRKGGAAITGANAAGYAITSAAAADAGSYDCVVSNACGSIASTPATLAVNTGPDITAQPTSQTKCAGQSVMFTAVASGTAPVSYQWKKNNVDITGANLASYTIDSVTEADAGSYTCVATNGCGSAASNAAVLTVNTAPVITFQPQSQTICQGGSASFAVIAEGTAPLTYQWQKDGVDISGAVSTEYVATEAGDYTCTVTNSCATVTSAVIGLTVGTHPAVASITPSLTGPTSVDSVDFAVVFSEPVTGFGDAADVTVNHSGTANTAVAIQASSSTNYTVTVSGITGDGSLSLSVNADAAQSTTAGCGSTAFGPSAAVTIDNIAPTPPTLTLDREFTNNTDVSAVFNGSTDTNGIEYRLNLDGGTYQAATSPHTISVAGLSVGVHTAGVVAVDPAGNTSTEASASFTIDRTNPEAELVSILQVEDCELTLPSNFNANQGEVAIFFTAADTNLDGTPTATIKDAAGYDIAVAPVTFSDGYYRTTATITAATANGAATVTVSALDKAGNAVTDTAQFNVNKAQVVVDIELDQVVSGLLTRCITFRLGNGTQTHEIPVSVEFTDGAAQVVLKNIPHDKAWTCISAKDRLHTLRRTVALSGGQNDQFTADMTGNSSLVGGDVTNDNKIDILDFGVFVGQCGRVLAPVGCGFLGRHPDISGNGTVGTDDFTFIQSGFLTLGDYDCQGTVIVSLPRTAITVAAAKAAGISEAETADVNHDGIIDLKDVAIWTQLNMGRGR